MRHTRFTHHIMHLDFLFAWGETSSCQHTEEVNLFPRLLCTHSLLFICEHHTHAADHNSTTMDCHDDKNANFASHGGHQKRTRSQKTAPLVLSLNAIRMIFFLRAISLLCQKRLKLSPSRKSRLSSSLWRCFFSTAVHFLEYH